MSDLLVVKEIVKKYGNNTALNKVSIKVPHGSIFGLLGPNGAGKTSLLRIVNQILMPDEGAVMFEGEPLQPQHTINIGYMPEERGLYKTMRVGDQVLYLSRLKGLSGKQAKERAAWWFERFEIKEWWHKKVRDLSKGMAQKIQFIVTVMHRPKLLIFDEPFSGFDPINAAQIKEEILRLQKEGATVIFSTHRMESVEELCDNIALIDKSSKILDGKLSDIKRTYKSGVYETALITDNKEILRKKLAAKFELKEATFKTINDELKVNIQLNDNPRPNELLQYLTTLGEVTHFSEVIPCVNDIFVRAVNENKV